MFTKNELLYILAEVGHYAQPIIMQRGRVTHYMPYLEPISDRPSLFDIVGGYLLPQIHRVFCLIYLYDYSLQPLSWNQDYVVLLLLCEICLFEVNFGDDICVFGAQRLSNIFATCVNCYMELSDESTLWYSHAILGTRTCFMIGNWERRMIRIH